MAKKTLKEKLDGINEYEREPVPKDKVKGSRVLLAWLPANTLQEPSL